jgi:hypothetical protein
MLALRPLVIFCLQLVFLFATGSWEATLPWWPFQAIAGNVFCFVFIVASVKKRGLKLSNVYGRPFPNAPRFAVNKLPLVFGRANSRFREFLRLAIAATAIFILFGMPAILFSIAIARLGTVNLSVLPPAFRYAIVLLLPVTQILAEIPWYYGFLLPWLENDNDRPRVVFGSIAIVALAFALQHAFMPFSPNLDFTLANVIGLFPLILLIAFVIRFFPRLTPVVLAIHGLLAVNIALSSF